MLSADSLSLQSSYRQDRLTQPSFIPQSLIQDQSIPGSDPNSPEVFKQNIQLVHEHVGRLQTLARSAVAGIQNAYHSGSNPSQIEAHISALKQTLELLTDLMHHTGVGALPLLPLPTDPSAMSSENSMPTEQHIIITTTHTIQLHYERLNRLQTGASAVANLLNAPEQTGTRPTR